MNSTPLGFLARLDILEGVSYKEWYDEKEDMTHCSLDIKGKKKYRNSEYGETEDLTQLRTHLLTNILKEIVRNVNKL